MSHVRLSLFTVPEILIKHCTLYNKSLYIIPATLRCRSRFCSARNFETILVGYDETCVVNIVKIMLFSSVHSSGADNVVD